MAIGIVIPTSTLFLLLTWWRKRKNDKAFKNEDKKNIKKWIEKHPDFICESRATILFYIIHMTCKSPLIKFN